MMYSVVNFGYIEDYALPFVAVGAFLQFFIRKQRIQYLGQVIFGFGMLFLGLRTMGDGLRPLRGLEVFQNFIVELSDNPILGVLVGTIFTVVVQSSSATIGILQTLADEGMIELAPALPVLFGDNIGTTITAVLAAIGASVAAKRAAAAHVFFNILGTIIFVSALKVFYFALGHLIDFVGIQDNIRMQIAFAHGMFNVSNTLIQLPFVALIAVIVTKLIPGEVKTFDFGAKFLDKRLLSNPSIGLGQARYELLRMGETARESMNDAVACFFTKDAERGKQTEQKEMLINLLDKEITEYLVKLQQNAMSEQEAAYASIMMQSINDIERIGDHAENIMELAQFSIEHKITYSDAALAELEQMTQLADETINLALHAMKDEDHSIAQKVLTNESELDQMEREFKKNHTARLNKEQCNGQSGAVFLDILSNLERIGDHSKNIAQYVLYGE